MELITSERLAGLVRQLRPEEREPLALAYFGGHSYRKVAEILSLPEGTVKSRIRSGLTNLRTCLSDGGIDLR